LLHGFLATGMRFPRKGVLLSLGPIADKYWFAEEARIIAQELHLPIYATRGTAEMLAEIGIPCTAVEKNSGTGVSGLDAIDQDLVDFVINVAREYDLDGRPDGYWIRRHAVDLGVPLVTDLQLARAIVEALRWKKPASLEVLALDDYVGSRLGTGLRS
jgi:carbamoyl-phosphate synthase large subunit